MYLQLAEHNRLEEKHVPNDPEEGYSLEGDGQVCCVIEGGGSKMEPVHFDLEEYSWQEGHISFDPDKRNSHHELLRFDPNM